MKAVLPFVTRLFTLLFALACALVSGGRAAAAEAMRALEVDLPLAGLRVPLNLPVLTTFSLHSRWDATHAEDVLVLERPDAPAVFYAIGVAGRTARDCPLDDPFPIEIGGEVWIRGRRDPAVHGVLLCKTFIDARALVRITTTPPEGEAASELPLDDASLGVHLQVLRPLLDAIRMRKIIPGGAPPLPPPETPLDPELTLPTVGLVLTRPEDGQAWVVAQPTDERDFDALIRVLPVFPEVQVAVRRHALAEVNGCPRLARHLLNGLWSGSDMPAPEGWSGVLRKRIGRFESVAICRVHEGALLDVRAASRPEVPNAGLVPMFAALAASRVIHEAPPSPLPYALTRAVLMRWSSLSLGLEFPGTVSRRAEVPARVGGNTLYGTVDLGVAWMSRNGAALAASVSLGADGRGGLLGATLETGVALALDSELTFVLSLALDDRRDALYANRSLSLAIDMRSNQHRPHAFAWSLRVVPLQLASREPAITGLPLAISWTGLFTSGLLIGADLRWISSPTRASQAWASEGLGFGLRIGVGSIRR